LIYFPFVGRRRKRKRKKKPVEWKMLESDSVFAREEKWKGLTHCYIEMEERRKK